MRRFMHILVVLLTTSAVTMFALNMVVFQKEKYTGIAGFMLLVVVICLFFLEMLWGEVSDFSQYVFSSKKGASLRNHSKVRSRTTWKWDWGWLTKTSARLSLVVAKNPWASFGLFVITVAFLWWMIAGIPLSALIVLVLIAIVACITHVGGWEGVMKNWKEIWAFVSALIFLGSLLIIYLYGFHRDVMPWLVVGFLSSICAIITIDGKWGVVRAGAIEAFFGTKHRMCFSFGIMFTSFGLYMMQKHSEKGIGFLVTLAGFLLLISWFFYLLVVLKGKGK